MAQDFCFHLRWALHALAFVSASCAPSSHSDGFFYAQAIRPVRVFDIEDALSDGGRSGLTSSSIFPLYAPADLATQPFIFVCFDRKTERLFLDAAVWQPEFAIQNGDFVVVRLGRADRNAVIPHRIVAKIASRQTTDPELPTSPVLHANRPSFADFEGALYVQCQPSQP